MRKTKEKRRKDPFCTDSEIAPPFKQKTRESSSSRTLRREQEGIGRSRERGEGEWEGF
jgi:hypothetical protein